MKKKLVFILLVLIAAVALSETYFRIFFFEQLKTQSFPLIYEPDSLGGYKYIPSALNIHIAPSYNISKQINQIVNSHGYFGRDFKTQKNTDTFRIAIFGYSFNSGGDITYFLKKKFNDNNKKVEIINCSVDGAHNNWHMYRQIRYEAPKYEVDLVLFETYIPLQRQDYTRECYRNYVMEYSPSSKKSRKYCTDRIDRIYKYRILTVLYDYSYIVRAICKKLVDKNEYLYGTFTQQYIAPYRKKKILSDDRIKYKYTFECTFNLLKSMSDYLRQKGIELVILNYFKNSQEYDNLVKSLSNYYQINYINLAITPDYYKESLRLEYDGHPNERGYKYIADGIYNRLASGKYIPIKF